MLEEDYQESERKLSILDPSYRSHGSGSENVLDDLAKDVSCTATRKSPDCPFNKFNDVFPRDISCL
jgi:hypothetical protein